MIAGVGAGIFRGLHVEVVGLDDLWGVRNERVGDREQCSVLLISMKCAKNRRGALPDRRRGLLQRRRGHDPSPQW